MPPFESNELDAFLQAREATDCSTDSRIWMIKWALPEYENIRNTPALSGVLVIARETAIDRHADRSTRAFTVDNNCISIGDIPIIYPPYHLVNSHAGVDYFGTRLCHESHIPHFINLITGYTCGAMTMAGAIYSWFHKSEEGGSWWPTWLGSGFNATNPLGSAGARPVGG
ncbi:hypothetical protein N7463_003084 [Penicillium fimorum]|uniref:Uncharacterized protein n=1 Tax=Penicillium fimorum TaxID=1882269 RepID=A0A9W9Y0E4_9EURO|nr:hypothetical protein N7463_003084 [Penicillium fimorum]